MQLAAATPAAIKPQPQGHFRKPTILFVDDEERILRSLKLLFMREYQVRTASSGQEALEILRRETVHALVSDQRMPQMTGVELLRQARDVSPNTMRLLLTGYSDIEAIIGSINEGEIFRYISKPWNQEEIRDIVASAAAIALSLETAPGLRSRPGTVGDEAVRVLLIDGAAETAPALKAILDEHLPGSQELAWASSLEEAMAILEKGDVGVVVSELRIGNQDTTAFLKALKRYRPEIVTIVLSTFQDGALLVEMVNQGQIHRFLPKPLRNTMTARGVLSGIQRHREMRHLPHLAQRHRVEVPPREPEAGLVQRIKGIVRRIARPLQ